MSNPCQVSCVNNLIILTEHLAYFATFRFVAEALNFVSITQYDMITEALHYLNMK